MLPTEKTHRWRRAAGTAAEEVKRPGKRSGCLLEIGTAALPAKTPKGRKPEMWNDDESPEFRSNYRSVISAWLIVVVLFFGLTTYSAIHGTLT